MGKSVCVQNDEFLSELSLHINHDDNKTGNEKSAAYSKPYCDKCYKDEHVVKIFSPY